MPSAPSPPIFQAFYTMHGLSVSNFLPFISGFHIMVMISHWLCQPYLSAALTHHIDVGNYGNDHTICLQTFHHMYWRVGTNYSCIDHKLPLHSTSCGHTALISEDVHKAYTRCVRQVSCTCEHMVENKYIFTLRRTWNVIWEHALLDTWFNHSLTAC